MQKGVTMRRSFILGCGAAIGLSLTGGAWGQDGEIGDRFVDIDASFAPAGWRLPDFNPQFSEELQTEVRWSIYDGGGLVYLPGFDPGPVPMPPPPDGMGPQGCVNEIGLLQAHIFAILGDDQDDDPDIFFDEIMQAQFDKWDSICGIQLTFFGREQEDWIDISPDDGCDLDGEDEEADPPLVPNAWQEDEGFLTIDEACRLAGFTGLVGDIRIAARRIDGPEGRRFIAYPPQWHGPNNLTDNGPFGGADAERLPDEGIWGNIVLDIDDFLINDNELLIREIEHYIPQAIGIAIGLPFDCPDGESLMALNPNEDIQAPTIDDIRAAHYIYGSNSFESSSFATPSFLPFAYDFNATFEQLSIRTSSVSLDPTNWVSNLGFDETNDVDIFQTYINDVPVGFKITITATPTGGQYFDSEQPLLSSSPVPFGMAVICNPPLGFPRYGEPPFDYVTADEVGNVFPAWSGMPFLKPNGGICVAPTVVVDATRQIDLQLHFYGPDRVLLESATSAGLGSSEVIEITIPPHAPGDYFFAVTGDGEGLPDGLIPYEVQLYDLEIEVTVDVEASARGTGELVEAIDADLLWALGFTGESKLIGVVEGFSPNEDHVVLSPRVDGHIAWQGTDEPVIPGVSRHATATAGVVAGAPYDEDFENFTGVATDATIVTGAVAREELSFGSFAVSHAGLHYALFGMADPTILSQGESITEGVSVINQSWGSPLADITASGVTALANDALVSMTDTLIVAAAGNEGLLDRRSDCGGDDNIELPGVRFRGAKTVGSPATSFNVLSIGSTGLDTITLNQFNNVVPLDTTVEDILDADPTFPVSQFTARYADIIVPSFSAKGPIDAWNYNAGVQVASSRAGIHLVAPGVGTVLSWPLPVGDDAGDADVLCPLVSGIPLSGLRLPAIPMSEVDLGGPYTNDFFTASFDGPESLGGTSFSAALVSGTALLLQEYGEAEGLTTDPVVMKAILMNSATRLPGWSPGSDPGYPQDIPVAQATRPFIALDVAQGAGIVNARAALENYSRGTTNVPETDADIPIITQENETPGFGGRSTSMASAYASGLYIDNLRRNRTRPTWQEANRKIRESQKGLPETEIGFERADKDDPDLSNPTQGGAGGSFSPRIPAFFDGNLPGGGGGGPGGGVGPGNGDPFLIFTEIMYHPASTPEVAWEWIEVYNAGSDPIDLTGWVFDDEVEDDMDTLPGANIAGGNIPPRGTALLFNGDFLAIQDIVNVWGPGNWVPVVNWPGLSNDGEGLALWESFADYGDGSFNGAAVALGYGASRDWPESNAESSIYLVDLSANPSQGENWALSEDGIAGAYESAAAGTNGASSVGSPGRLLQPSIVITEILYNPASTPDTTYEFVEIYNPLDEPIDLAGWVFDNRITTASDTIGSANIAEGTVPPGETAMLYNADELEPEDIEAIWGAGNWVAVTNWPGLLNDGDVVALWSSYDAYDDENFDNANNVRRLDNTQFFVEYDDAFPWPEDNGRGSIYVDIEFASATDPALWSLSVEGTDGAYRSERVGDNMEFNVASPAHLDGIIELPIIPVTFIGWDHAMIGQENGRAYVDYLIDSPLEVGEIISVTLAWNRHVTVSDPDFSDPDNPSFGELLELELEDLGLELWRSDEFGNIFDEDPEELLAAGSNHSFDTVEHFRTTIVRPSFYVLRVRWNGTNYDLFGNMSPADVEYGVAWRVTPQPNRVFGFMELNRLLDAWGSQIGDSDFDRWVDINYDFVIDFQDLSALLDAWRNG